METANIYFADNSHITVNERDTVLAIIEDPDIEGNILENPMQLSVNIHNGIIHDLVNIFLHCSFFRIAGKDVVYNTSSMVKIK